MRLYSVRGSRARAPYIRCEGPKASGPGGESKVMHTLLNTAYHLYDELILHSRLISVACTYACAYAFKSLLAPIIIHSGSIRLSQRQRAEATPAVMFQLSLGQCAKRGPGRVPTFTNTQREKEKKLHLKVVVVIRSVTRCAVLSRAFTAPILHSQKAILVYSKAFILPVC
jgi:hypothetical protein